MQLVQSTMFYIYHIINHTHLNTIIYTILKHINKMQFYSTQTINFTPKDYLNDFSFLDHSSPQHQYSWMDQYFCQNVLEDKSIQQPRVSTFLHQQNTLVSLPNSSQSETSQIVTIQRKNKSVFHNFQKHLLTLLKKVIIIKKTELATLPSGNRAYDLWKIFIGLDSYAKKNLYIIFGVAQRENERNIREAAQQIPQLQRMLNKYGIDEVETAQKILRRIVSSQATQIQRTKLECECKMKKFQEFYCYFRGFIQELAEGGISRRMTKERKLRLIPVQQRDVQNCVTI